MTHPPFAGLGGHHRQKKGTDVWLTAKWVIDDLGGWRSFHLDPCSLMPRPWRTACAHYYPPIDGLTAPWPRGKRLWCNPPYSNVGPWLKRMAEHNNGVALIFARTDTDAFHRFVYGSCTALLYIRGRLHFHRADGSMPTRASGAAANAGGPSVLCAYGHDDADVLAGCGIDGHFEAIRLRASVVCLAFSTTWHATVSAWLSAQGGQVTLADIYRAFASHPKAGTNPNYEAKIRQVLQHGAGRRVRKGVWEAVAA